MYDHKGEFADLRQPGGHSNCRPEGITENPHHCHPDEKLADYDKEEHQAKKRQAPGEHVGIYQSPESDEEERHERIAKGYKLGMRVVKVVGSPGTELEFAL